MTKEIQVVYQQIKDEIISLKREPGSPIKEIDIARKFGISRTPVRDVFTHLECDDLLDKDSSKGTFIKRIDIDKISDIMYVRSQLEISVLNEIMDVITPGDIVKFKMVISDQRELLNNDLLNREEKIQRFLELEVLFIKMCYQKAAKESIFHQLQKTHLQYVRYLYLVFSSYINLMFETCRYSEMLIDSLEKRDRKKVSEICSNQKYIGLERIRTIKLTHQSYFK